MAGTVTVTENAPVNGITRIQWDWLSDASGNADQATSGLYSGEIVFAAFDPDAGDTQPSDNYDITITDSDGYDVLAGQGANLSQSANDYKLKASMGAVYSSTLTLNVSGAGNAKGGIATVFIR